MFTMQLALWHLTPSLQSSEIRVLGHNLIDLLTDLIERILVAAPVLELRRSNLKQKIVALMPCELNAKTAAQAGVDVGHVPSS